MCLCGCENEVNNRVNQKFFKSQKKCFKCGAMPAEKAWKVSDGKIPVYEIVCTECYEANNLNEPIEPKPTKVIVEFSDFQASEYDSISDAENAILEAHAEGVSVDYIEDEDGNPYSCVWNVQLQKES
jgi:hypothetical protein